MERHYKKQRAGTLDAHKKGYDEENYKRQLQRQKPMMLVKARDRKIS